MPNLLLKYKGITLSEKTSDRLRDVAGLLNQDILITRGGSSNYKGYTHGADAADLSVRDKPLDTILKMIGACCLCFKRVLPNAVAGHPHIHVDHPRSIEELRSLWNDKS